MYFFKSQMVKKRAEMQITRYSRLPWLASLPIKHNFRRNPKHNYLDFLTHPSLITSYIKVI